MQDVVRLSLPFDKKELKTLKVGDRVLLTGEMLVFRDAGHKRLYQSIQEGKQAFEYAGETIYFMGPCPARDGEVLGSAGPTTSCRMDKYTPYMLDHGLCAQIGKGKRSDDCIQAFKRNGGVLGAEAVRRIKVKDFPAVVAIDTQGNTIYNE